MLIVVLLFVLVGFGLLAVASVTGTVGWGWVSVAVSVVAGMVLVADWKRTLRASRDEDMTGLPVPGVPHGIDSPTIALHPTAARLEPVTEAIQPLSRTHSQWAAPKAQGEGQSNHTPGGGPPPTSSPQGPDSGVAADQPPPDQSQSVTDSGGPPVGEGTRSVDTDSETGAASGAQGGAAPALVEGGSAEATAAESEAPRGDESGPERPRTVGALAPGGSSASEDQAQVAGGLQPITGGERELEAEAVNPLVTPQRQLGQASVESEQHAPGRSSRKTVLDRSPEKARDVADTTQALRPVQGVGAGGDTTQAIRPVQPAREPGQERPDPAAAAIVATLEHEVLVVDEQPRYHLVGCRSLAGHRTIALQAKDAVELEFTPCAVCTPVRVLARTASQGGVGPADSA